MFPPIILKDVSDVSLVFPIRRNPPIASAIYFLFRDRLSRDFVRRLFFRAGPMAASWVASWPPHRPCGFCMWRILVFRRSCFERYSFISSGVGVGAHSDSDAKYLNAPIAAPHAWIPHWRHSGKLGLSLRPQSVLLVRFLVFPMRWRSSFPTSLILSVGRFPISPIPNYPMDSIGPITACRRFCICIIFDVLQA